jgi:hypothetical protein
MQQLLLYSDASGRSIDAKKRFPALSPAQELMRRSPGLPTIDPAGPQDHGIAAISMLSEGFDARGSPLAAIRIF